MKRLTFLIICVAILLVNGYATTRQADGQRSINISSVPSDASIIIYDINNNILINTRTPAIISLSESEHRIEISKEGFQTYKMVLPLLNSEVVKIPILGSIPLLGKWLFSARKDLIELNDINAELIAIDTKSSYEYYTTNDSISGGIEGAVIRSVSSLLNRSIDGSRIAVLNIASSNDELSADIIDEVMYRLDREDRFTLVNRQVMAVLRTEQNFQMSSEVDEFTAVELGGILGVEVVITGRLSDIDGTQRLILQAIDVRTAEVLGIGRGVVD